MDWGLIVWTVALLPPLLWLVRQVHQGLQELFFILSGDKATAVYLFQVLMLPGVVLHESSHYLTARLLRVRVRRFSLSPKIQGQKVQMGAVVMDKPEFVRGVLIGLAPLVVGSIAVVLVGQRLFDVRAVIDAAKASDLATIVRAIQEAFTVNDAWIWLYLIFAISNAMLPSESDRESLLPMIIFVAVIAGLVVLAGWGPQLLNSLATPIEAALGLLLVAFGATLFVDVIFVGIIWFLRGAASRITGRRLDRPAR
jgi:hypothetical protein